MASVLVGVLATSLAGCASVTESIERVNTFVEGVLGGDETGHGQVAPSGPTRVGWVRGRAVLESLGGDRWLDNGDQSILDIVCGHIRRWERPGTNLDSLRPLQGDPFLLPDPNQLVSAQTWFWVLSVDEDGPRVAQSRYQKTKTDDGGFKIVELWEIRDLRYSTRNEYRFSARGVPTQIRQSIHPALPSLELSQDGGSVCSRRNT